MKKRLILVLFWAFVLHIIVSATFILDPPFLRTTRVSRVYKTHLVPGPFFTASRIIDNYSLSLSWKVNGTWSPTIDPAREDFNHYHASLNPADLYKSRISRTLYLLLTVPDSSVTDIKNRQEFPALRQFLYDQYVPPDADSVRMWLINKQAVNFILRTDSVYIAFSK